MTVQCLHLFNKKCKNLNKAEQEELKKVIEEIISNPTIGDLKTGDLSGIRVYKKHLNNQLYLIGYTYCSNTNSFIFKSVAPHENFYRDLKNYLKS